MCNQKWLLCFVILILTACGASIPAWVKKPPANENMVYAVASTKLGSNETEETAIERARLQAKEKLLQSLTITQSSSPYKGNPFYRIFRWKLETIQPTAITGFKTEKTYVSKESDKTVYVLLSLNRQSAIQAIRADMSELDASLGKYESVSDSLDKLAQFKKLVPALPLIEKRRHLEHQLMMLRIGEMDIENPSAMAIEKRIYTLADELKILLKARNKKALDMRPYLIQEITTLGFKVFDTEKHPDIIIEFGLKTRKLKKDQIEFVFATGNIKIRDNKGRILKGFVKEVKGASSVPGGAYERAAKNLGSALGDEFVNLILSLLEA
jgi:hypothetical protein